MENQRKRKFDDFSKHKIFLKNIFIVINKKKYLNFFFSFSKLKNNLLVNSKTDQILINIKIRILKIQNLFKIIDNKKKKKPFVTKRIAFLRWKIRVNPKIVKNMLSKLLIQQPINLSCIYRLKKICENKEYERNMGFLNFVLKIFEFLQKVVLKRNLEFKTNAMKKIQFFCLDENEKLKMRKISKFIFMVNKKAILKSTNCFDTVLENYPLKNFLEKIEKGNLGKKKIIFKKLIFFLKFYRFKSILKFVNILKKKLREKTQNAFFDFKSVVFYIIEKIENKKKNDLKRFFEKLRLHSLESNLKNNSMKISLKKFKNFLMKKKMKIILLKLKQNSDNYKGFEILGNFLKKSNNKNLKNGYKKILGNYINHKNKVKNNILNMLEICEFFKKNFLSNIFKNKVKNNILNMLERKFFLKNSQIFKKLKAPLLKKNVLLDKIDRKLKISFYFKKLYILKKLQNLIRKKKIDPKSNLLEILKNKLIEKKFNIFYLLKKNSDSKNKKIKKVFQNLKFAQKQKKRDIFNLLKKNKKNILDKIQKIQKLSNLLELQKSNYQTRHSSLINENFEEDEEKDEKNFSNILESVLNFSDNFRNKKEKKIVVNNNFHFFKEKTKFENFDLKKLFISYVEKIFKDKKKISKLKSFLKIDNGIVKEKLRENSFLNLEKIFCDKKKMFFYLLKKKLFEDKKKILPFFILKNLEDKKKRYFLNNIKNYLRKKKIKGYFLPLLTKNLIKNYILKKKRIFRKLRYPNEESETKKDATKKIKNFLEKFLKKNLQNSFRKIALKSPLAINRKFSKVKKLFFKNNFKILEESFLLIKACKSDQYSKYLKNPEFLVQIKKMISKQIEKQKLIALSLKEPCYLILKENANLLKNEKKVHLENLMYLFKNFSGLILRIKKIGFELFDFKIYKNEKNESELKKEYKNLEKRLMDVIKEKLELVKKLNNKNFDLIKDSEETYKILDKLKNENKLFENELDEILLEKKKLENELNILPKRNSISIPPNFEIEKTEEQIKKLSNQILDYEKKLNLLNKEKNVLKTKINDLKNEENSINLKIDEKKEENEKLNKDLKNDLNLINELEEKNIMLKTSNEPINGLLLEIDELKKKISSINENEIDEKKKLNGIINKKNEILENKKKFENIKGSLENEINELIKKNEKIEEEIFNDEKIILENKKNLPEKIKNLENIEDDIKKLNSEINSEKENLEKMRKFLLNNPENENFNEENLLKIQNLINEKENELKEQLKKKRKSTK